MKLLAIFLFVGAALSNSTHYYAWKPQNELVFRYESEVDFSIPEIRSDHKAGLRLSAVVRVQAQRDYTLLIKLDSPRLVTFNGVAAMPQEEIIPAIHRTYLEQPFKVHLRRGVVEAMFVDREEPVAITNIKKAVVSNLNMDLSASRRSEVLSNNIEVLDEQTLEQSPLDQSYFTVREQSLQGDCETSYTVHPVPEYEAMEAEYQMEQEELKRNEQEHISGGLSQAKDLCRGKKYWHIHKTRNFDNCLVRPVFQKWSGVKTFCDSSKASCEDLSTHMSSTKYIVCGNDIRDFVIRKSITENAMSTVLAWKTEEKFLNKARVVLELLKSEAITTPLVIPTAIRTIKSLVMEFPEKTLMGNRALNEQVPAAEVGAILPKPDLVSAPKMLIAVNLNKDEIARQVIVILKRVAQEIFESPESCTSNGDVAGHLAIVTKALRPLSLNNLKYVESRLESQISAHQHDEQKKVIRSLFYDVISMVGTNPAVMLVKERLRDTSRVDTFTAIKMLQTTISNIKTPTQDLLRELVNLVKTDLRPMAADRPQVYNVALIRLSALINKACMDPTKANAFPEKIYGPFCNRDSPIVMEFADFLEREFTTQSNRHIKLNVVNAIGKLGHIRTVQILTKVISDPQYDELIRSLAVYSLKTTARLEPIHVKPILLAIIDNAAEAAEVRIAAIAVVPYAQPSTAELQKIAVRTWLEPSKQVASFIYSTFKSLVDTEVPDLKVVGQRVKTLMTLVKPFVFGVQYAKNIHTSSFVKYLNLVTHNDLSWTDSKWSLVPVRHSVSTQLYGPVYHFHTATWTTYTRGMDKWINLIMMRLLPTASPHVKQALSQINSKLNMQERIFKNPEMLMQLELFDFEDELYVNEARVMDALDRIAEILNHESLTDLKRIQLTRATKIMEAEGVAPTDAGLPFYMETSIPVVLALKASAQMEIKEMNSIKIPTMLNAKIIPIINVKMETAMGVISPFTHQLIGSGVEMAIHSATPLEMKVSHKLTELSLEVKVPEEVRKEMEFVHVFITPYTVKKDIRVIEPVSKSAGVKIIVSGQPMKDIKVNIGEPLEVDAKLIAESDAKYTDLYSYWQKIKQHNPYTLIHYPLPSTIRRTSVKVVFNPRTSKTKEISLVFGIVKVTKDAEVTKLPPKMHSSVSKTFKELNKQGTVVGLSLNMGLRSQHGYLKGIHAAMSVGIKKESATQMMEKIQMVSHVEVKSSSQASPVYEIRLTSKAEIPRISNRWNKDLLVEEALKLMLNGQIEFGYANQPISQKKIIKLVSHMVKSEEQKRAVKLSPEFQRCTYEEQQGKRLANVCELSRHQAASLDEIVMELELPTDLTRIPILQRIGDFLRAYFIGQFWTEESTYTSTSNLRMLAKFSRIGQEAQLEAEIAGHKYRIVNLRLPKILKGVVPVSMRNPLVYNIVQKLTRHQLPGSCRVEPKYVSTFDNKTYGYTMNDCWHLLFKDRYNKVPVAVLARNVQATKKEVRILAGTVEVTMRPDLTSIDLNVQGVPEKITIQPGEMKSIRDNLDRITIKRYTDNVVLVSAYQDALWVLFDGERVEVAGSLLLKSRSAGLCGDLDGENTADLKTPRQCVMSRPRFAAYTYMIQETCQGIPVTDQPQYNLEKQECIKEQVIPTPLERLTKIVAAKASEVTKPIISQHLVQRQVRSGQLCLSFQKINLCSKMTQEETEEPKPVKVIRKRVDYVCYDANTTKAQQLEQRAKAGETLDLQMVGKDISFSRIEYEPIVCQRQSNQI